MRVNEGGPRHRLRLLAAGIAAGICFAASTGAAQAAGPSWQYADLDDDTALSGVACPAASECFATALDDSVFSEQGGTIAQLSPDAVGDYPEGVSCSSTSFCMLSGDKGEGTPWTSPGGFGQTVQFDNDPAAGSGDSTPDNDLLSLSCAPDGSDFCAALDHGGNIFTYSSGTWHDDGSLLIKGSISYEDWSGAGEVSCATSHFCIAVLDKTDNDNSSVPAGNEWFSWNSKFSIWAQDSSSGSYVFGNDDGTGADSLSCSSSDFCISTDSDGNAYKYTGSNWAKSTVDGGTIGDGSDLRVGCAGTLCMAVDASGKWWTTSDGSIWTAGSGRAQDGSDHSDVTQVSCASSTACYVSDGLGWVGTYGVVPQATVAPSLPSSGTVGTPVSLAHGTWSNPDAALFDQWLDCAEPSINGDCRTLDGQTGLTYTPTASDAGGYLVVQEDATIGFSTTEPVDSNFDAIAATSTGGGGSSGSGPGGGTSSGGGSGSGGGTSSGGGSGGTGAGSGGDGGTTSGGGGSGVAKSAQIGKPAITGFGVTLPISCPASSSASCSLTVTLTVVEIKRGNTVIGVGAQARKSKKVTVVVGSGSTRYQPGGSGKFTVVLNAVGRKLLQRYRHLAVHLSVKQAGHQIASGTLKFR